MIHDLGKKSKIQRLKHHQCRIPGKYPNLHRKYGPLQDLSGPVSVSGLPNLVKFNPNLVKSLG
jgi:hypothetical protein